VVLVRAHGRLALIDTGNMSMRTMLIKRFAERGVKPADITDLLLTHSHHDHSANWTMFPKARIVIGADELAWSLTVPWGRDAGARTIYARVEHMADLAQSGRRARSPGSTT
jgi:glyoxylase-like metal-dependent hydrolase (beta-lactamase superfamily II)